MNDYLLRIEGMNMDATVLDTHDLSTIRGSSLALLEAVRKVGAALPRIALHPISTGASIGLYSFAAAADPDAAKVRDEVDTWLRTTEPYSYLVFAVDVVPLGEGEGLALAQEAAIAANRWRQLRVSTVALPRWNTDKGHRYACAIDHVRVATERGPGGKRISKSTLERRGHGRKAKQKFYQGEVGPIAEGMEFVNDFEALTENAPTEALERKMAVFYADGNSFSKTRQKLCKESPDLQEWDKELRAKRRDFLRKLLAHMKANAAAWTTKSGEYQLEVLLWGGDEFLLVTPAWNGWTAAELFFTAAASWAFRGTQLHHAGGLVFCHHKAPIQRIRRLAEDLAGLAKKEDRSRSLLAYEVLEAFDHTGGNLERYRAGRCPAGAAGVTPAALLLSGDSIDGAEEAVKAVRSAIPRGRLQRATGLWRTDPDGAKALIEPVYDELKAQNPAELGRLEALFGTGWPLWAHLLELWDYVGRGD